MEVIKIGKAWKKVNIGLGTFLGIVIAASFVFLLFYVPWLYMLLVSIAYVTAGTTLMVVDAKSLKDGTLLLLGFALLLFGIFYIVYFIFMWIWSYVFTWSLIFSFFG